MPDVAPTILIALLSFLAGVLASSLYRLWNRRYRQAVMARHKLGLRQAPTEHLAGWIARRLQGARLGDRVRALGGASEVGLPDLLIALSGITEQAPEEWDFEALYQALQPDSRASLEQELDELVREGQLNRIFRVQSPETHGGIRDFADPKEIPSVIHDWHSDTDITVEPRLVEVVYRRAG